MLTNIELLDSTSKNVLGKYFKKEVNTDDVTFVKTTPTKAKPTTPIVHSNVETLVNMDLDQIKQTHLSKEVIRCD
jgi:hypothetical protein